MTATRMATAERDELVAYLAGLGVDAPIVPYPAHHTVEEGKRLRGNLPGTFTKNLLLKDKKGSLFFVTDRAIILVDDRRLDGVEQVNFHPMTHTESIGLTWDAFTALGRDTTEEDIKHAAAALVTAAGTDTYRRSA